MIELLPLFLFILYLAPFMVAAARSHDMLVAILLVNVLLGWTVIGWIAVFFWALFSSVDHAPSRGSASRTGNMGLPEARRVKGPMVVRTTRSGQ